jgi:hypothetical protein
MAQHKSLRHMPFRAASLVEGLAVMLVADTLLLWQMRRVLEWHTQVVARLLEVAGVPWETGRETHLLGSISATLLRTNYLDYSIHPYYPAMFTLAALGGYLMVYRRLAAPLKPLLGLAPAGLGITFLYYRLVWPMAPYTPEEFSGIWYRGEAYLWLLLPLVFALSFFILNVPFMLKLGWLAGLMLYSFVWSALRLAVALSTFYYFGWMWMPLFYFAFGFLSDFLYIVAFYSLAMNDAAAFLGQRKEVWQ